MSEFQNSYLIQWGIENFSCCVQESGQSLESSYFKEDSSNIQEWRLKVYPRGVNDDSFISFELWSKMPVDGIFNYTISAIDSCGSNHFTKEVGSVRFLSQPSSTRITDFIRRDDLFAERVLLLPDDTLTLQCTINRPFKQHSVIESIRIERSSFTWPIANFSSIEADASNLTYPLTITFERAPRLDLMVCLEGNSAGDSEVCIKFHKTSKYKERYEIGAHRSANYWNDSRFCDRKIHISFEISMIDINRSVIKLQQDEHNFFENKIDETFCWQLVKRSYLISAKSQLLPKDTLTLAFNLKISDGSKLTPHSVTKSEYFPPPKPSTRAFPNIPCEELYNSKRFSDVVLKVGKLTLSAHKAVLHSQSPVFQAMLDSDMVEKKTGVINIVDFDADTMNLLLQLLYTGKVDEKMSLEGILKLYAAAHKYEVPTFKDALCPLLIPKITTENVSEVISCALKYDDAALKEASQSFLSKHVSKSVDQCRVDDKERLISLDYAKPKTSSKKRKKTH